MELPKGFVLLPTNKKQIAAWFNVSKKTLDKWLAKYKDKIGPPDGYYFSIPQLLIIMEVLTGLPPDKIMEMGTMG